MTKYIPIGVSKEYSWVGVMAQAVEHLHVRSTEFKLQYHKKKRKTMFMFIFYPK
jgi:hypothetical protein